MHEALFYTARTKQNVQCQLCPWNCMLSPGQTGNCKVRENVNGSLITHVYNKVAALGVDPIEKKPLYHFFPGKNILSIGEVGCNLHCSFCQNHNISQCYATEFHGFHEISSKKVIQEALKTYQNVGIAYTYNEPFTFYEFMLDIAKKACDKGLKNVVVSNGYINPLPLKEALPWLDAFNIDLKAFTKDFYRKYTKGSLSPVQESLKIIAKSPAHLEITNLVIPGLNDNEQDFKKMINWISGELGTNTPFHLSRYFPQYQSNLPPTPIKKLEELYEIASEKLNYVFLGNVSDEQRSSTYCPGCRKILIQRNRYRTKTVGLDPAGLCIHCSAETKIVV